MKRRLTTLLLLITMIFTYINFGAYAASKKTVALNTKVKFASLLPVAKIHAIYNEGNQIFIRADRKLVASAYRLTKPERIVMNIPYAKLEDTFNQPIFVQDEHPILKNIRYSNFSNQPPTVRVVADLSNSQINEIPFEVNASLENEVVLRLDQTEQNEPVSTPTPVVSVDTTNDQNEATQQQVLTVAEPVSNVTDPSAVTSEHASTVLTQSLIKIESVQLGNFDLILKFNQSVDLNSTWLERNQLKLNLNQVEFDKAGFERLGLLLNGQRTLRNQASFSMTSDESKLNHELIVQSKNGYIPVLFSNEDQTKWTIRAKNDSVRVMIDAGHGGIDVGAISVRKHYEKDFTLDMAKRIYNELLNVSGIVPILTRSDDRFLTLDARAQFAKNNHGDLFISIHANSNERKSIQGTETYYADTRGKEMAKYFHAPLVKATGLKDRNTRQAKFYVLRNNTVPAILLEIGYFSNASDEAQMNKDSFRERVAKSVADSTKKYVSSGLVP